MSYVIINIVSDVLFCLNGSQGESNINSFTKFINDLFMSLRKINGIYYISSNQTYDFDGSTDVQYYFSMTLSKSKQLVDKIKNKKISSLKQLELLMGKPSYDFWSDESLRFECERRNFKEKEYIELDHKKLVDMLNRHDKVGGKKKVEKNGVKNKQSIIKRKQERKMKKINVAKLTLVMVEKMDLDELSNVSKQLKLKPSKIIKNNIIRIKKHMRAVKNDIFFGKVGKAVTVKTTKTKSSKVDKKVISKKNHEGSSLLNLFNERLKEAIKNKDTARIVINKANIRKEKERIEEKRNMSPEVKQQIKEFKEKYAGKKINWTAKLKKAGILEDGMASIPNFEKYRLFKTKGGSKFKVLLKNFRKKRDERLASIKKSHNLISKNK